MSVESSSSSTLLGSAFERALESSALSIVASRFHGEASCEVLTRQGQLRALMHQNLPTQVEAFKQDDATDIDWLEAALRIKEVSNPLFYGFIKKFRQTELQISQLQELYEQTCSKSLSKMNELVRQANAISKTVSTRKLKPNQIATELKPLQSAYSKVVVDESKYAQADLSLNGTIDSLCKRVIEDDDTCQLSKEAVVLLERLGSSKTKLVEACEKAYHRQTWECFNVLSILNQERGEIRQVLSMIFTSYDAITKEAAQPQFHLIEGYQDFQLSSIKLPIQPGYHSKVNWKQLAVEIFPDTYYFPIGLQPTLNWIEEALVGVDAGLNEVGSNIQSFNTLHSQILFRINSLNDSVEMDESKWVSFPDIHKSYHALIKKSTEGTTKLIKTLAEIESCFPSDPIILYPTITVLNQMGFAMHLEGNLGGYNRIQAAYAQFLQLDGSKKTEWGPENSLAKEIRWDFDRLGWILEGWNDPWLLGVAYFKIWHITNSYIQRDVKDLPADLYDD